MTIRSTSAYPHADASEFRDRQILLVGCVSGIGLAAAHALHRAGANLALIDRDSDRLAALSRNTGAAGAVIDVSAPDELADAVTALGSELGGFDAVWSNVGVQLAGSLSSAVSSDLDLSYQVNVRSHFVIAQSALPFLGCSERGAFLLTASNSGLQPESELLPYTVTKAAAIAMVKQMAHDHASEGVRFNALCPGYVDTPFNEAIWNVAGGRDAFVDQVATTIPAGRMSSPEEIADVGLWLLSDSAGFVNGHAMVVDGGELVR